MEKNEIITDIFIFIWFEFIFPIFALQNMQSNTKQQNTYM